MYIRYKIHSLIAISNVCFYCMDIYMFYRKLYLWQEWHFSFDFLKYKILWSLQNVVLLGISKISFSSNFMSVWLFSNKHLAMYPRSSKTLWHQYNQCAWVQVPPRSHKQLLFFGMVWHCLCFLFVINVR